MFTPPPPITTVPCGGYQHCEPGAKPRMHIARYEQLMNGIDTLAAYEVQQGWHFCPDCDGMLIVAQSCSHCTCMTPDEARELIAMEEAEKQKMMEMGIVAKHAPHVAEQMKQSYFIKHDDGSISGVIYETAAQ